jgi:hypothetical protein
MERHACPKCGSKAEWDPGKAELVCPYCGTSFPREGPPPMPGGIVEHDLDQTLRDLGSLAKQVDTATRRVQCSRCHAVLLRQGGTVAQHCDFCGSPELLDYQDIHAVISPESLLPAVISQEQAYHALKGFLAGRWFAPSDLKRRNMIDDIRRVYLPYWTFDAHAECPWEAQSGDYYYVTVTDKDSEGRTVTRQERRIRWYPSAGHVSDNFDDVLISASRGIDGKVLGSIEPFPTSNLVPYDTRYVSGWQVEQYQVPLADAARQGFQIMDAELTQLCGSQVPGDTYQNLRIFPEYSDKTFKHVLAPVWLLTYRYRDKVWQGAVNAVTGQAYARFPLSPWKILIVVVLSVIALLILFRLISQH